MLVEEFSVSPRDGNKDGVRENMFGGGSPQGVAIADTDGDKNLEIAHSAQADTIATYEVLAAQLEKYNELKNDVNFLSKFSEIGGEFVDSAWFIRLNIKGEEILCFGKYRNITLIQIWNENPGYFSWFNQADFPQHTKNIMKELQAADPVIEASRNIILKDLRV